MGPFHNKLPSGFFDEDNKGILRHGCTAGLCRGLSTAIIEMKAAYPLIEINFALFRTLA